MAAGPIRIAFLTSIRDVGGDDRVGQMVVTEKGPRYMEGLIERAMKETLVGGALHEHLRVALVITDDREKDLESSEYGATPEAGKKWIFPSLIRCDDLGMPANWIVKNLPSDFRSIPKNDVLTKKAAKKEYEHNILKLMKEFGVQVLVSDHYMARIEYLNGEFGLYGKVLNIHPAVTCLQSPFCCRGATPTADVLTRASKGIMTRTGATLHFVNEEFDDGPIIHWTAPTPVRACDTPEQLRYRNYQQAKLPVFVDGMRKYATEVFPTL